MWKTIDIFAQPAHFCLISPFWIPPFIKHFSDHPPFLENLEDLIPPLKKGGSHYAVMADYVTNCLRSP